MLIRVDLPSPVWPAGRQVDASGNNDWRTDHHDVELEPSLQQLLLDLRGDTCQPLALTSLVRSARRRENILSNPTCELGTTSSPAPGDMSVAAILLFLLRSPLSRKLYGLAEGYLRGLERTDNLCARCRLYNYGWIHLRCARSACWLIP